MQLGAYLALIEEHSVIGAVPDDCMSVQWQLASGAFSAFHKDSAPAILLGQQLISHSHSYSSSIQ